MSSAIEGQFAPVCIRGERYVDADWSTPLPVRLARALGATRVLAVDVTAHLDRTPPGAERYLESDRQKKALVDADAVFADQVLKLDFGYWVTACHASSGSGRLRRVIGRRWRRRRCGHCTPFEVYLPERLKSYRLFCCGLHGWMATD